MKLITAPDPLLETMVDPYDYKKFDTPKLALDMITMCKMHSGLGISANQVGVNGQIFVMKTILNKKWGDYIVVINPLVKAVSRETELQTEGCLSHPDLYLKVKRPISCAVEFDTLVDNYSRTATIQTVFNDIDARIFLHEYDHLQGIQFVDRVSKHKLKLAVNRKLKKDKK